jgi:hypothetical protein
MVLSIDEVLLEVWADSFHEGEWFVELLKNYSRKMKFDGIFYEYNFMPIYRFHDPDKNIRLIIKIYGDYGCWTSIPQQIKDVIDFERPDVILYDPQEKKILLVVEETSAVPTGNQAPQRAARSWWASTLKTPFVYLVPEVGEHTTDNNLRTCSMWIPFLQLKLSWIFKTLSLTLFFGNNEHPEDYDYGKGPAYLGSLFNLLVMKRIGYDVEQELNGILVEIFRQMSSFVIDHYKEMVTYLPGITSMKEKDFSELTVKRIPL